MFFFSIVSASLKTLDYINLTGFDNDTKFSFWKVIITMQYIRPVLFLVLPFFSLFKNNKYTWIFIQSYFYFLLSNLIFQKIIVTDIDFNFPFLLLFFSLIILPLLLMNYKKVYSIAYKIKTENLLLLNIIASTLGMLLSLLLLRLKY
jgi:hypothetical protein